MRCLRYLCFMAILAGSLVIVPVTQSEELSSTIFTRKELDAFIQSYYLDPRPELVARAIDVMTYENVITNEEGYLYRGFFLEVYASNPKRRAEWEAHLELKSEPTRSALLYETYIYKKNPEGGLGMPNPSEQRNDKAWGAFFATGKGRFINIVINDMMHVDEREDRALFTTGAAAKLSLANYARLQPKVSTLLKNERNASEGRKKQLISDVLTLGPDKIKEETDAIIAKQKEQGKWLKP
ncbi:MAG TPA: hypothetical protein VMU10_10145 [Desulfomonilia bacterium]|nr:hypothetical protein [Desulfomonilia bacterium]